MLTVNNDKLGNFCKKIPNFIVILIMLGCSFIFFYPYLKMLVMSFFSAEDLNNFTVSWIPRNFTFSNYSTALQFINYFQNAKNTLIVTAISTAGQMLSCAMTGYALGRYKFRGRSILFAIVLIAMVVPIQTYIVPQYLLYSKIGWLNTYLPLTVPAFFGYGLKGTFFTYIFMQYFASLPKELSEAAKVDGCGFIKNFIYIMIPIARSSFLVVFVFAIVWHWSDYYEPAMFISVSNKAMIASGLENLSYITTISSEMISESYDVSSEMVINNATLMAGALMITLPVLVIFCFLQRRFVQGIEHTGLTGE